MTITNMPVMSQFSESPYEYLKYKIMNAPVYTYPYPHLLIENIFPEEFYAEIMKNIPETEKYTPKPLYPGKKTLTLENIDGLDEKKMEFWKQIQIWLTSTDFSEILLKKFSIDKIGHSDYFLHKDLEEFEVKPHRDIYSKLVTYLFYLPEDDSLSKLGTDILVPKKKVELTTKHQNWDDFNIVKRSKYMPNSFFAFTPCDNSYHAVKVNFPKDSLKKERNTIRGFVFDKTAKDYPAYLFDKK